MLLVNWPCNNCSAFSPLTRRVCSFGKKYSHDDMSTPSTREKKLSRNLLGPVPKGVSVQSEFVVGKRVYVSITASHVFPAVAEQNSASDYVI